MPALSDNSIVDQLTDALSPPNVGGVERVASVIGGSLLTLWGLRRATAGGYAAAATGGVLVYRGVTGRCPGYAQLGISTAEEGGQAKAVHVKVTVTVDRPRDEVYAFWRELENLPRFMEHLSSVQQTGEKTSHWEAVVPGEMGSVEWDAKITDEEPGERLAWRSNPDADLQNAGTIRFRDAPGNRGTEVHASIEYRPPAGALGAAVAGFLNPALSQLVKEDVRRFKRIMETGEAPTTEGQPAAR